MTLPTAPEPTDAERQRARAAAARLRAEGPIGLVLGGGGAKGAYQVGCWRALRECGLERFEAIAGTSVGALNAVLVAQDDFARAESIWADMRLGRVLRLRWHLVLAVVIRLLLLPVVIARWLAPARVIPVALWRALREARGEPGAGPDPVRTISAALHLYRDIVARPQVGDIAGWIVVAVISVAGVSAWWMASAPLLTLLLLIVVAPLASVLLLTYAGWGVSALDFLATRLVLASNSPLHQLLLECIDAPRLRARASPLYVTLSSLGEVTRRIAEPTPRAATPARTTARAPKPPTTAFGRWWQKHVGDRETLRDFGPAPDAAPIGPLDVRSTTTIEYVPSHFDLRQAPADQLHELVLQSAGLPEIFPARRFGGRSYVDGGLADNEPVAALCGDAPPGRLIVMPLDHRQDEAAVRAGLAKSLEKLGRPAPAASPRLLVLTPSRSLGNFIVGTLGFRAERCRALMVLGYRDTLRRLAAMDAFPSGRGAA